MYHKSETPWWVLKLISNWQNILHYRQSWSIGILYEIFCCFWRPLPSMVNTPTICFLSVHNNMLQMRSYRFFNLVHSKSLRRSWPMRSLYVELANLSYYTPSSIWPQANKIMIMRTYKIATNYGYAKCLASDQWVAHAMQRLRDMLQVHSRTYAPTTTCINSHVYSISITGIFHKCHSGDSLSEFTISWYCQFLFACDRLLIISSACYPYTPNFKLVGYV